MNREPYNQISEGNATAGIGFGFGVGSDVSQIAEYSRIIEELGYDFIAVPEHLMLGNPPRSTPMSVPALGVAAGATKHIRLLSSVVVLPLYNPVLLAKEVTTLDNASNGRYIFGTGIGGESTHEFRAAGVPISQRGSRANEALGLLKSLWTGQRVSFRGKYYQVDDVTLNPAPTQKPHPPIWVGGRQEAAMERAARFGDGWFPYMLNPERYRQSVAMVRNFAAAERRDLEHFSWCLLQYVAVGESREDAFKAAVEAFPYSQGRNASDIVRDYWAFGRPRDIIERLEAMIEAGAHNIVFNSPVIDVELKMQHARILAKEVVPYFKAPGWSQRTESVGSNFRSIPER